MKTYFCSRLPRNLFIYTEPGLNAIAGITAIPCTSWSDFKKIVTQLRKPEARDLYDSVTIDTIGHLWSMAEKFICARHNVDSLIEVPYGKAHTELKNEFESTLRQVSMLGFGILMTAHSEIRVEKSSDGESDVEIMRPALEKRCYAIVNQMVDFILYAGSKFNEDGTSERWLWTRETPRIFAGTRFRYMVDRLPLSYDNLIEELSKAIEREGEDGAVIDDSKTTPFMNASRGRPFEEAIREAKQLWDTLVKEKSDAVKILGLIEEVFGRQTKLSEVNESQQELLEEVIQKMTQLLPER